MLGFAILAAAIMGVGHAAARFLYGRFESEQPSPLELLITGAVTGIALWIAANWILAITFTLRRGPLRVVALLFVLAALATLRRPRRISVHAWGAISMIAVALWVIFVMWRGSVVPPGNHDVLTYHLPKAVMMMRAGGLESFNVPDARLRTFPANYELLLADVLILTGSDQLIEWISTICYVLFIGIVAMYARRWWGKGMHVSASAMAAAGIPLLLVHSGHPKNDLLTAVFTASAIYWSARWCARGGVMPAVMAILCGVTAIGTKMTAASIVLGVAPFGIAALLRRRPRPRAFAAAIVFAAIALLLCGGWVFVVNASARGEHLSISAGMPTPLYGDWPHVWELPYLIISVSLGLGSDLPWNGQHWPWPTHNLFASHFGPIVGLCILALPFCVWRYRKEGDPLLRRERAIASGAVAIAFVLLLPIIHAPRIASQATVRYALFLAPVIICWTIAPLVRELAAGPYRRVAHAVVALLVVAFLLDAGIAAADDAFAPLDYALWCAAHPGTRQIYWQPLRAESVVDRMAGAHDKIAVTGDGRDTWIYPAYGAALSRDVVFVTAPREIPADAQWIVVDQLPEPFQRPAPNELRFYDAVRADPRFILAYRDSRWNQAVFRRR